MSLVGWGTPKDSNFERVYRDEGPKKRGLIDQDRRSGTRSLSIDVIGDLKIMHISTGVIANNGSSTVYLTNNGEARGTGMFAKKPSVTVEYDSNSSAGGFIRGQGSEGPNSGYSVEDRGDIWKKVHWVANTGVLAVTVTNKSGTARDFIVTANGV